MLPPVDTENRDTENADHVDERPTKARGPHPLFVAFVIIASFLLFLSIFGLQIAGLVAAFRGQANKRIQASWCSPMFSLFGVSELDLDCVFHTISQNPHKGLGCIELPGKRQQLWLMVTIITVLVSVLLEAVDFIILCFVPPHWPCPCLAVEMKRPWSTIIFGFAMLVLILGFGANDAYTLPQGISEKIWLIVDAGEPFVCTGILSPAGLRGQFLGWLDGLLQSWGVTYFG